ncbi:MAG: hypothetical protein IJX72_06570 [Clostridia bacterium]|nr:hypothetical protein [Clostridia bacterium]
MTHRSRVLPLPLLLLLLLLLSACSPVGSTDDFAYAAAPFTATVRGTYTPKDGIPRPITAKITAGAPVAGEDPAIRPVTVTFTEPPSLSGVTVTAAYETDTDGMASRIVTFSYPSAYGEVKTSVQAGELDGFLRFAEALLPIGDVTSVTPAAEDGTHTVTRITEDGTREAVFLFSPEQALPLRVTVKEGAEAIEFTVTP